MPALLAGFFLCRLVDLAYAVLSRGAPSGRAAFRSAALRNNKWTKGLPGVAREKSRRQVESTAEPAVEGVNSAGHKVQAAAEIAGIVRGIVAMTGHLALRLDLFFGAGGELHGLVERLRR